jgi:predicted RNase H-like HicB family nuclease
MQYQIFVQSRDEQRFVASVVGMSHVSVEGGTEAEAIAKVKMALEEQLATGKLVTIEIDSKRVSQDPHLILPHAGIFAQDPTFDDWMKHLAVIRQEANALEDIKH